MAESRSRRPKGPTQFDLLGMNASDFESMVARLVRLEFPDARKPSASGDGGADMALPDGSGGYQRCWQAKHFPGAIHWRWCSKSLADAQANWSPDAYTFCFPRELTAREQKTFDKHFRRGDIETAVDYWNGDEIQARLIGTEDGMRVARTFFDDAELDREMQYRAIEAGGRLDTPMDALDRLDNLGQFLAGRDDFFTYPIASHEAGFEAHGTPSGSVMSVEHVRGAVTNRMDVVPRDDEAMDLHGPQFVVQASDTDDGAEAAARFAEAVRSGTPLELNGGLDITFTRMPPGLQKYVGQRLTSAAIRLGPGEPAAPLGPWPIRVIAESAIGKAEIGLELFQADSVPTGWDEAFVGGGGGLSATLLFRFEGEGAEVRWSFSYEQDRSPMAEQLVSLEFLEVLSAGGTLSVAHSGEPNHDAVSTVVEPSPLSDYARVQLRFLRDLTEIGRWTGRTLSLPESVTATDVQGAAVIASIIRHRGRQGTWQNSHFILPQAHVDKLRQGRHLRLEQQAYTRIFGEEVVLGYTCLDLRDFIVASVAPVP